MSLWDLIRDFFVQNIFGGYLSNGSPVQGMRTGLFLSESNTSSGGTTFTTYIPIGVFKNSSGVLLTHITLGDWLSTTFTIITLILLVIFLYIFVKWIFKLFAGLLH